VTSTLGSICPNRSTTPCTPKSGDAGRPDGADRRGAERGDHGLGNIRDERGDTVAGDDALLAQRRRETPTAR
jgi:hypothetical protein